MNKTLYMNGLKHSWKLLVIFAAVLTMYYTIIVTMFDPQLGSALLELEKAMPELLAIVGMRTTDTTLIAFMASYLYGFIALVFPMVYAIIMANSLVAKRVDSGSMAYLLAAPVPRFKVAFTQMKVLCTGIFLLIAYATAIGLASAEISFPGELDVGKFIWLNVGALALHILISGICFLASCVFNDTKYSVAFGAGIPALCFIVHMMGNAGGAIEGAKYFTFFTLFNPQGIIAGEAFSYSGIVILAVCGLALYALGILVFTRKDVPV